MDTKQDMEDSGIKPGDLEGLGLAQDGIINRPRLHAYAEEKRGAKKDEMAIWEECNRKNIPYLGYKRKSPVKKYLLLGFILLMIGLAFWQGQPSLVKDSTAIKLPAITPISTSTPTPTPTLIPTPTFIPIDTPIPTDEPTPIQYDYQYPQPVNQPYTYEAPTPSPTPSGLQGNVKVTTDYAGGLRATDENGNTANLHPNYIGGYQGSDNYGNTIKVQPNYAGGIKLENGPNTQNCTPNYVNGYNCN